MLSIIKTMVLNEIDGYLVEAKTNAKGSLPKFDIVGNSNVSVREAKEYRNLDRKYGDIN